MNSIIVRRSEFRAKLPVLVMPAPELYINYIVKSPRLLEAVQVAEVTESSVNTIEQEVWQSF